MNFTILTIFPEMFDAFRAHGMVKRAIDGGIVSVRAEDIRQFTEDRHRTTDDRPFGGGCGMVMKPEPLASAIRSVTRQHPGARVVYLTPQGRPFDQVLAARLAHDEAIVLICGRYEGVDDRIVQGFVHEEISIGDYVLTGGELAAMVVVDAVTRLIPGVLGGAESAQKDSFAGNLLEHAHYTRPRDFEGQGVPDVLLSGNHEAIERWRQRASLIRTFLKRPDLMEEKDFTQQEIEILKQWRDDLTALIRGHRECA